MPENNAVVETPTEQEITEQYLEKRADGEVNDLPVPPPTIPEVIPEPPAPSEPPPPTPEVAEIEKTDAYLEERKERKDVKRKARAGKGGVQARIDALTKEKAEAEEKAARLEAEKSHAPIPPGTIDPEKTTVEPEKEAVPSSEPKPRPRMNEFTDADEYHAAMALWAADERARTNGVPKTEQPKVEPQSPTPISQIKKEEFDRFLEKGKSFMAGHPDFNTTLEAAHVRGLTMSESARTAITRMAAPEVAYWLAKPENDLAARSLMAMDDLQQVVEVGRIAERLAVLPSDFVSQAPAPGLRLTGNNIRPQVQLNQVTDTDEYIRLRRQQRRESRGRR
jgi:hypothetical protein